VTSASLSPPPVNGWYKNPSVTLAATDQDADLDRSEYRLDGGPWLVYGGPVQVIGDGQHMLDYRSVDKAGHVEATHRLAFAIDATPPEIQGIPASCAIWPPDNTLVQIATVTASDAGSGVAPESLLVNVSSNESIGGDDILIVGTTVHVRANRSAHGTGRIYTLTAQVSDVAGNEAQATAVCTVPHDQSKKGH
jgi:hypothetical protein